MGEGNGKPAAVEPGSDGPVFTIKIVCNTDTNDFNVEGLNVPPWIALGMLSYMEVMVRRREMQNMMAAMAANAPRIAVPGGRL